MQIALNIGQYQGKKGKSKCLAERTRLSIIYDGKCWKLTIKN
jgi:hypothetical protein